MKKLLLLVLIIVLATPAFAGRGKVVATVNGTSIYQDSVDFIYKEIPAGNIEELGGKVKVNETIIAQLVSAEALKQAALKSGVDKSENFKKAVKMQKEKMIQEEYLRVNVAKRVSEAQIKETYEKALKAFEPQMEYNIYNILSGTEADAKAVIKQLKKGEDFQKVAVAKSKASNVKKTKGDLGFVKKSDLIENVAAEIGSMKKGKFSKKPVKSPFGWNVFYLKEKRLEKAPTYKQSKDSIKQALYKQEMMVMINELKEKATVEYK